MLHDPLPRHRFFFALLPPIILARQIAQASHWFEFEGTPVSADRLHMTLFILDDLLSVPRGFVAQLLAMGDAVAATPTPVSLGTVSGGRDSIALRPERRIEPLQRFRTALEHAASRTKITERARYAFSPHMTLGYRKGEPFNSRVAPVGWEAQEFVLIHSHLGKTQHEIVSRWPLSGSDPQGSLF